MTDIERLEAENKRLKGQLSYLRSRCVQGAEKYFDTQIGLLKIVTIKDEIQPKEKAELENIRKRVVSQREEIKKLQESLERRKDYVKELERLVDTMLDTSEFDKYYEERYRRIKQTA